MLHSMAGKLKLIFLLLAVMVAGASLGFMGVKLVVKASPAEAHSASQASGSPAATAHDAGSAREIWDGLMAGNARFVAGQPRQREMIETRRRLAKGQHPHVIVIGCADSRLSPELIFDQNLGDLFVVRTAGNIADPVALGSIEYAAEHLHARLLVVLGHEKCGAVTAAASGQKMPTPGLAAIVRKIAPALAKLKGHVEGDELISRGVTANVEQSAHDIVNGSPILRKEVHDGKLSLVKAVYRLESGKVDRLP
jgi:carbonic anhydrase